MIVRIKLFPRWECEKEHQMKVVDTEHNKRSPETKGSEVVKGETEYPEDPENPENPEDPEERPPQRPLHRGPIDLSGIGPLRGISRPSFSIYAHYMSQKRQDPEDPEHPEDPEDQEDQVEEFNDLTKGKKMAS